MGQARVLRWAARGVSVFGLLVVSLAWISTPRVGAVATETPLSGPQVFGWGFASPSGVASDGTHVWVILNVDVPAYGERFRGSLSA
jgi:hypothetical protein